MSTVDPSTVPTPSDDDSDDDGDEAEHSIKATRSLAIALHDALQELDIVEDVWSSIEVTDSHNAESAVTFTVEDEGLYYTVQVVPKPEE